MTRYEDDSGEITEPPPGRPPLVEQIRLFALIGLTAILVGLSGWLALPFLPAVTWAVALAVLAWPLHRGIGRWIAPRRLAAASSTAIVTAVLLGAGLFITYQVASETAAAARNVGDAAEAGKYIQEKAESVPALGTVIGWLERLGLDLKVAARSIIESNARSSSSLAQGSLAAVVQCLLAIFILYYLFLDRDRFLDALRDLLPLSRAESDFLFSRAADSVHATVYATVVTSVIDSVAFGLMFWWAGLPAPVLWSVVMFLLSLLPVLGAGLIWVPATVYLAWNEDWLAAAGLAVVGAVTAVFVDNMLYAWLAGGRMRMHNVPVLIAFLGGLAIFGVSGMILGPAILAVTEATLEVWRRRIARSDGTETGLRESPGIIEVDRA